MKKFKRLPAQTLKEEIQQAALQLFIEKGFAKTTMENIVANVSLSKGGVYRIYGSTLDILKDLIIAGMHLRNEFYQEKINGQQSIDLDYIIETIVESLFLYPDISKLYVEFLWEKQRNAELESLYQEICKQSIIDPTFLLKLYDIEIDEKKLEDVTNFMNATILSLHTLHLFDELKEHKDKLCQIIRRMDYDRL